MYDQNGFVLLFSKASDNLRDVDVISSSGDL